MAQNIERVGIIAAGDEARAKMLRGQSPPTDKKLCKLA